MKPEPCENNVNVNAIHTSGKIFSRTETGERMHYVQKILEKVEKCIPMEEVFGEFKNFKTMIEMQRNKQIDFLHSEWRNQAKNRSSVDTAQSLRI